MDSQNSTASEIQPLSTPEPDFKKIFNVYLRTAQDDARDAAFAALPFIRARKPGLIKSNHWAPKRMREVTYDEQSLAYDMGRVYSDMLAAHYLKYDAYNWKFTEIIKAVVEAGLKHPRRGAQLRAGFMDGIAVFAIAGMRASRSHLN